MTSPEFESFIAGMLCGAVVGAAATLSRRLLGLVFGLGGALIVFVLIDQGVPGLEAAVRQLIDQALLHQHLFFDGDDGYWSVRSGDWKLVSNKAGELELYNLNDDIGESTNIASQYQNRVDDLHQAYQSWRNEMAPRITAPGD